MNPAIKKSVDELRAKSAVRGVQAVLLAVDEEGHRLSDRRRTELLSAEHWKKVFEDEER